MRGKTEYVLWFRIEPGGSTSAFKHWMDIVHNHDNGSLDWLFHQNVFALRESNSIMCGNGIGFTLEKLFRSAFTEL